MRKCDKASDLPQRFDFDEPTYRRGTDSVKWDSCTDDSILPLWVADMDFRTAPAVTEAVCRRAQSGIYGYVRVPDEYKQASINWFSRRYGWNIDARSIIPIGGLVPALSTIVKALVPIGCGVIFQTPAYNCFFACVERNGRHMALNPLRRVDVTAHAFSCAIDFKELERLCSNPDNRLLVLCNPHNPTGRVWSREELEQVRDICRRHDVVILSDEIHCELVRDGHKYIPMGTVEPNCISLVSPSKAFNIAGLMVSNIVCPKDDLRHEIERIMAADESVNLNPFGVVALQAAYNCSEEWLNALNLYLDGNYKLLCDHLSSITGLKICRSEATYLAWVDVSGLGATGTEVERRAMVEGHVWINGGAMYGDDSCIRINYATQRQCLSEGLDRLMAVLKQFS